MATQAQRDKIAELGRAFPREWCSDGYDVLRQSGFTNEQTHGEIDPEFLTRGERDGVLHKPEGFCVLKNGKIGFCDHFGVTYEAPDEWQA